MSKEITPRGIRNNNPLNIRKGSQWRGETAKQTDTQFEQFESMQMGVRAALIILRKYMSGYGGKTQRFDTIEKIIERWSPPSENNTGAYQNAVSKLSGIGLTQGIDFKDRRLVVALVDAMIRFECGLAIPREVIESAYDMV